MENQYGEYYYYSCDTGQNKALNNHQCGGLNDDCMENYYYSSDTGQNKAEQPSVWRTE